MGGSEKSTPPVAVEAWAAMLLPSLPPKSPDGSPDGSMRLLVSLVN